MHAQVIKKIEQNRVVNVGTMLVIGSHWRLEDALEASVDSTKLNIACIERFNLIIRQGSGYLNRRSPCRARKKRTPDDRLELLRCHYNSFVASIRFRGQNTSDAGRFGVQEACLPGPLRGSDRAGVLCACAIQARGVSRTNGDHEVCRVTTADEGSTPHVKKVETVGADTLRPTPRWV